MAEAGEILERLGERDAGERLIAILLADLAGRDLARHVLPDLLQCRVEALLLEIVDRHVIAAKRHHMGDATPHLPCANHADLVNRFHLRLLLRCWICAEIRALHYVVHRRSS